MNTMSSYSTAAQPALPFMTIDEVRGEWRTFTRWNREAVAPRGNVGVTSSTVAAGRWWLTNQLVRPSRAA